MSDSRYARGWSGEGLAELEGAAARMARQAEAPRWFMLSYVAVIAAVLTSFNVAPWGVTLGLASLGIPLLIAHLLLRRKRPKLRALARKSVKYMSWALVMVAVLQASVWWIPAGLWLVALKGVLLFLVLGFLLMRMNDAETTARVKEAHERAI